MNVYRFVYVGKAYETYEVDAESREAAKTRIEASHVRPISIEVEWMEEDPKDERLDF